MQEEIPDFTAIIEVLVKHQVDFVIVGGVCAVLLGAPVATFDLDIVHSRSKKNIIRLMNALVELNAHYREHLPKKLQPTLENLTTGDHHLLTTRFGPLDVLGSIGIDDDYQKLDPCIEKVQLGEDVSVKILQLETLINVKEKTARKKDIVMLEILKAMRDSNLK